MIQTFKRNQVEGAIAEALGQTYQGGHEPKPALALRLKRLIETDRLVPVRTGKSAFFDEAPPGRGALVTYSPYSVFALYVAVCLHRVGLPQSDAVRFMRRIRPSLEPEHRRILTKPPQELLDHDAAYGLEREVKEGLLVRDAENMHLLVVQADDFSIAFAGNRHEKRIANICHSQEEFIRAVEALALFGSILVAIELVNPTHRINYWLNAIEPVHRGRKS